jgi:hypothetical protein
VAELLAGGRDDAGLDVVGVTDGHGLALAVWPFLLPAALVLVLDEGAGLAFFVAVALALADGVAVLDGVPPSPGLAAPPAVLVLPLADAELGAEPPGEAFGFTFWSLADLPVAVDVGLGGQVADAPLAAPTVVPPGPGGPPGWPSWLAVPAGTSTPPLLLEDEIPTAEPSWTRVSRSGGKARATPSANTAQAAATAGRNQPYFHFHGCGPPRPGSPAPPRAAFQRRTRPARKPPAAPAFACLLAWADPAWTRARIRSSPSGRGST